MHDTHYLLPSILIDTCYRLLSYLLSVMWNTLSKSRYLITNRLQNPKWPLGGPNRADGRSHQLLLNMFFDPRNPSMRKGCDGGKRGGKNREKKEKTDENRGHLCHCQQSTAQTPTDRTPHAHAKIQGHIILGQKLIAYMILVEKRFLDKSFCPITQRNNTD